MLSDILNGFRGLIKGDKPEWDYHDRRKLVRLKCHYSVKGSVAQSNFDGTVIDVGVLGLKLSCTQALQKGQIVKLTLHREGQETEPVECRVVWTKLVGKNFVTQAGAVYSSDVDAMRRSWVNYILYELGFKPDSIYSKRRFVRAECSLNGILTTEGHEAADVQICNLGVGGALLGSHDEIAEGQSVELSIGPHESLPVLNVKGKAVRVLPDRSGAMCGIEFDDLPGADIKVLGKYLHSLLSQCESS